MDGAQNANDLNSSVCRSDAGVHRKVAKSFATLSNGLRAVKATSFEVASSANTGIRTESWEGRVNKNFKIDADLSNDGGFSS